MTHLGTKAQETPRLLLRPFALEDAPAMYRNWASDPEVTKYLTWPPHGSEYDPRLFIGDQLAGYADPSFYDWVIVLKSLGEPVGSIGVVSQSEAVESVHVGYCIGRRWWRQGITSEALAEVIRFFFEEVGANRVEARHDPRNPNSGRVMRACGMTFEGTRRQSDRNNQGICDADWYAILKSEFVSPVGEQSDLFSKRGPVQ